MGHYYTIYKESTEEIIAFGNAEQCTRKLGLKNIRQFYAFVSKVRSGLRKKYTVVIDDGNAADDDDS